MNFKIDYNVSLFSKDDIYYFKEGTHYKLFDKLGSHIVEFNKKRGVYFALWAPNARFVSLISDFNSWNKNSHPLKLRDDESGIWECFIEEVTQGNNYKYHIESNIDNRIFQKSDPYSFFWEKPPKSSSITWKLNYSWSDDDWMKNRHSKNSYNSPISIYELHLGSWRRNPNENNRVLTYRELAEELIPYIKESGFTHIELLPITEHPFDGSWGYQCIGYFAPTSRFGTPEDFMYLIDCLHQNNIGVILDWVPSHFAVDMHGLALFDGSNLYEHKDPKLGFHPEWGSAVFNFGRNEVKAFLISSAMFWMDKYHIDGIRVDAVASILYLNYAREDGNWIANKYGGNENLEAIEFLKDLNKSIYSDYPDTIMIAEESTAWPMVTKPPYLGGLGFGLKWNMGWMHDSLKYLSRDPIYRKYYQDQITFSIWYAFNENFMLSLSHDEVVHMKGSLINKMAGDYWQKFANLRLLYGYMFSHPGKKLLFMGCEFAQFTEWNYKSSLDWHLFEYSAHKGIFNLIKDLNTIYKSEEALYKYDEKRKGFEWISVEDSENSIISYLRKSYKESIVVVCNFTPKIRDNYKVGVDKNCFYKEIFNSDSSAYGGSNVGNNGGIYADNYWIHNKEFAINLTLPPLGIIMLKAETKEL